MTDQVIVRAAGYVALATALGVGVVHALAATGRALVSIAHLLAIAFPVLAAGGLAYILARHRIATPPRSPRWMLLAWSAAFAYMFLNTRLAHQSGPVGQLRELSGHLLAFLVVVGLGLLAVTRRAVPEGAAERAA